jgi:manganese-dependent inorganic pyrophosphatase
MKVVMDDARYRNYPVVEDDKLVGVVNRDNLGTPAKEKIILVDHNERAQSVEGIEAAKVIEIIDHHRLGGIQTSDPIFTNMRPVGSTATIVSNMFWQCNVEMPKNIAGLLLSAVVSDTVLFKSPTCTECDKKTAKKLAEIAEVDINEYGMAMLKAGSGVGNMTPQEIAKNDMKEFTFGEYKFVIGQVSVMDTKEVMDMKDTLVGAMQEVCEKEGYDMSLLMVTDILEESTELIFTPHGPVGLLAKAFKKTDLKDKNFISLPGVMSRKKQIVPPLTEAAQN